MQLALQSLGSGIIHPGCLLHASRLAAVACCSTAPAGPAPPAVHAVSSIPTSTLGAWQQGSSRGFTSSAASRFAARAPRSNPGPFAPSNFDYAITEVRAAAGLDAGAGTWPGPDHTRVMLEKINESVGGRWLLIECGTYLDQHQLAGRPARALVHVALCNLIDVQGVSDSSSSSSSKPRARTSKERQSERYAVHVLKEPTPLSELPPGSTPMLHYAPFELDGNGHLTGRLLGAPTQLEEQTNKHKQKKYKDTFRIVWDGAVRESLEQWRKNKLDVEPYRVQIPGKNWRYLVSKWYREMVEPVGVEVMLERNAAELAEQAGASRKGKQDQQAAAVQGQV